MNLYDVLGVSKTATPEEIRSAYLKKARETHPDTTDGSTEAFQEVSEAYDTLSDEDARAHYDLHGETRKVNNDEAQIMTIISNAFGLTVMGDDPPRFTDMRKVVLEIMDLKINEISAAVAMFQAQSERMAAIAGRFTFKDENPLSGILAGQKHHGDLMIDKMMKQIDLYTKARAIFEASAYRVDKKEDQPQRSYSQPSEEVFSWKRIKF